jgi:hypothetical protein
MVEDIADIAGSLWEYGALVVLLAFACYNLWKRNNYLQDKLIDIAGDYSDAIHELNELIKGDHHNDNNHST